MTNFKIPPFFFPTTVAFVDDSYDFLSNLSLQLHPTLAYRLLQSTSEALMLLKSQKLQTEPLINGLFSLYQGRDEADHDHQVIDISLGLIHRKVHDERRFDQIPVVVVDYDMPQMNGVEFCRQIQNPLIKKILLTGKADERIAVEAFNGGLIDRFIRKQDPNALEILDQAVLEMQAYHFEEMQSMLSDSLSVGLHRFLRDRKLAARFKELCAQYNIVEYYLTCAPDGMLMLDATGASYLLVVQNESQVQSTHEIAYDQGAPEQLLTRLRSGEVIPYFPKTQGIYSSIYKDWRSCLHTATKIEGDDAWYSYVVIEEPEGFNLKHVLCYSDYLERIDASRPAAALTRFARPGGARSRGF
ncbi:response regulator [Variovorax defluvii]|uniref:Response regulator n=1 Tax=Variovorax defluvii TaxID=913761 RepID=A0ABP8I5Y1_9BURK